MKDSRRVEALLVLGVLALFSVLGGLYGPSIRATPTDTSDLEGSVKTVTQVLAMVQQNYAVPVDADCALYDGAIPGMLRVLDPHSSFFNPHQWAIFREDQRGKYYGVGMTILQQQNRMMILAPIQGSPADRAGIRPGDVISGVNSKSVEGLTTSEVADLLKGARGTTVRLSVVRDGSPDVLSFSLTRDEIARHEVAADFLVRPGIGYLRLSSFESEQTAAEVETGLKQLDFANLDGLILDLRGNPGGLVDQVISIADIFLDKNQLIVSQQGRASQLRRYYAIHGNGGIRVPMVVLVNGGSASASEILSGSIQDHDRGIILGERTFGKALMQSVLSLSDDTGMVLTIARYYTPSGRLIQRDYKNVSLYDYLYNHKNPPPTEVKLTDGGRQVFGGGGITPDLAFKEPDLKPFQALLLRKHIFFTSDWGFRGMVIGGSGRS